MPNSLPEDPIEMIAVINAASDDVLGDIIHRLRSEKRLFSAVSAMNAMLGQPGEREAAVSALKRMGLWESG